MDMLIQFLLVILGFAMLVKGADWFVEGASSIATKLGIPQLVIGLTIVAMGTSAPEAAVSISAALKGSCDIAVGNIVGSNILNVLIILGLTAVITPLIMQKCTIRYEIPFLIVITTIFAILGLVDGYIGRIDGVVLLILFGVYLAYLFFMTKKGFIKQGDETIKEHKVIVVILMVVVGVALIVLGSNVTVDAATKLATMFGMSKRFIGLTIVALGTSLPELFTSVMAGIKGKADIAIGNIVGSNIFNILFVIGLSSIITPVTYQREFYVDSIICVVTVVLLLVLSLNKGLKLKRWGGVILLASYVGYFIYLIR